MSDKLITVDDEGFARVDFPANISELGEILRWFLSDYVSGREDEEKSLSDIANDLDEAANIVAHFANKYREGAAALASVRGGA